MRLSRLFRLEDVASTEESVPMRRTLFWILVWAAILAGVVLFFKYARFLTPLLD
jgi:hypothetical protein